MEPLEIVDALRKEIQLDRLELQRTINSGFEKMAERFQDHADDDSEQFEDINKRLTTIETKASTIGKAVWSLFITFIAAAISYGFSFFVHK